MKFRLIPVLPDGGGDLEVTAETADEVRKLIKTYKLFCVESCSVEDRLKALLNEKAALEAGHYTVMRKHRPNTPSGTYAWYTCEGDLSGMHPHFYQHDKPWRFIDPYKQLLKTHLGYEGPIPDMVVPVPAGVQFSQTRVLTDLRINDETICYKVLDEASPWNNMDGPTTAAHYAHDHMGMEFGGKRYEPEFIPVSGGGLMKHNPDYMKQHKPQPAVGSEWFLNFLLEWWYDNHANEKQKAVITAARELHSGSDLRDPLMAHYSGGIANFSVTYGMDWSINYPEPNGTVNWDSKGTKVAVMKWDEFKKLR